KETARGTSSGRGQQRFRSVLVVSEVALALVLLAGAGLMARSFERLQEVRPGFRPGNVLSAQLVLPELKYKTKAEISSFADRLVARVGALPGVEAAGTVNPLPLTQEGWQTDYQIEGRPVPARGEAPNSDYHVVSGAYFKAMGIPLVRGRLFDDSDREDTTPVVLVNETLARRWWPTGDAVGKRMRIGSVDQPGPWMTVVGVVGDARQYGLDQEQKKPLYSPDSQPAIPPSEPLPRAPRDLHTTAPSRR